MQNNTIESIYRDPTEGIRQFGNGMIKAYNLFKAKESKKSFDDILQVFLLMYSIYFSLCIGMPDRFKKSRVGSEGVSLLASINVLLHYDSFDHTNIISHIIHLVYIGYNSNTQFWLNTMILKCLQENQNTIVLSDKGAMSLFSWLYRRAYDLYILKHSLLEKTTGIILYLYKKYKDQIDESGRDLFIYMYYLRDYKPLQDHYDSIINSSDLLSHYIQPSSSSVYPYLNTDIYTYIMKILNSEPNEDIQTYSDTVEKTLIRKVYKPNVFITIIRFVLMTLSSSSPSVDNTISCIKLNNNAWRIFKWIIIQLYEYKFSENDIHNMFFALFIDIFSSNVFKTQDIFMFISPFIILFKLNLSSEAPLFVPSFIKFINQSTPLFALYRNNFLTFLTSLSSNISSIQDSLSLHPEQLNKFITKIKKEIISTPLSSLPFQKVLALSTSPTVSHLPPKPSLNPPPLQSPHPLLVSRGSLNNVISGTQSGNTIPSSPSRSLAIPTVSKNSQSLLSPYSSFNITPSPTLSARSATSLPPSLFPDKSPSLEPSTSPPSKFLKNTSFFNSITPLYSSTNIHMKNNSINTISNDITKTTSNNNNIPNNTISDTLNVTCPSPAASQHSSIFSQIQSISNTINSSENEKSLDSLSFAASEYNDSEGIDENTKEEIKRIIKIYQDVCQYISGDTIETQLETQINTYIQIIESISIYNSDIQQELLNQFDQYIPPFYSLRSLYYNKFPLINDYIPFHYYVLFKLIELNHAKVTSFLQILFCKYLHIRLYLYVYLFLEPFAKFLKENQSSISSIYSFTWDADISDYFYFFFNFLCISQYPEKKQQILLTKLSIYLQFLKRIMNSNNNSNNMNNRDESLSLLDSNQSKTPKPCDNFYLPQIIIKDITELNADIFYSIYTKDPVFSSSLLPLLPKYLSLLNTSLPLVVATVFKHITPLISSFVPQITTVKALLSMDIKYFTFYITIISNWMHIFPLQIADILTQLLDQILEEIHKGSSPNSIKLTYMSIKRVLQYIDNQSLLSNTYDIYNRHGNLWKEQINYITQYIQSYNESYNYDIPLYLGTFQSSSLPTQSATPTKKVIKCRNAKSNLTTPVVSNISYIPKQNNNNINKETNNINTQNCTESSTIINSPRIVSSSYSNRIISPQPLIIQENKPIEKSIYMNNNNSVSQPLVIQENKPIENNVYMNNNNSVSQPILNVLPAVIPSSASSLQQPINQNTIPYNEETSLKADIPHYSSLSTSPTNQYVTNNNLYSSSSFTVSQETPITQIKPLDENHVTTVYPNNESYAALIRNSISNDHMPSTSILGTIRELNEGNIYSSEISTIQPTSSYSYPQYSISMLNSSIPLPNTDTVIITAPNNNNTNNTTNNNNNTSPIKSSSILPSQVNNNQNMNTSVPPIVPPLDDSKYIDNNNQQNYVKNDIYSSYTSSVPIRKPIRVRNAIKTKNTNKPVSLPQSSISIMNDTIHPSPSLLYVNSSQSFHTQNATTANNQIQSPLIPSKTSPLTPIPNTNNDPYMPTLSLDTNPSLYINTSIIPPIDSRDSSNIPLSSVKRPIGIDTYSENSSLDHEESQRKRMGSYPE
ncbi:hypothetical protein WA158_000923 [Blastocystis sp. Blastoise]